MFFEERVFVVEDVAFSTQTAYGGKKLTINKQALIDQVSKGIENIETFDVHLAKPGEAVRIVNVLDGYEPRVEKSGQALFPGFLRAPVTIDPCSANCLRGVAVLTASKVRAVNPLFTPKQAVVDMSGPGALMSLFCETINIVLEIKLPADLADTEKDQVIRLIGIRATEEAAQLTMMDYFKRELLLVGWCVVLVVGIWFFGFYLASAVMVFLFIKLIGRRPLLPAASIAVALPLILYFGFSVGLKIQLYSGLFF